MRLGDLDALKDEMSKVFFNDNDDMRRIEELIDNAPTVDFPDWYKVYEDVKGTFERPQGECRSCRHRDPEDKRCDCGGLERQGCPFSVSDDYYCKYYERGGEDRWGVSYLHQDSITKSDTHL